MEFEKIKQEKMNEILYMIEIFDGKLSLTEVMQYEIPFLNNLKAAKMKFNEELKEEKVKLQKQAEKEETRDKKKKKQG